jgi:hypothetical protein
VTLPVRLLHRGYELYFGRDLRCLEEGYGEIQVRSRCTPCWTSSCATRPGSPSRRRASCRHRRGMSCHGPSDCTALLRLRTSRTRTVGNLTGSVSG